MCDCAHSSQSSPTVRDFSENKSKNPRVLWVSVAASGETTAILIKQPQRQESLHLFRSVTYMQFTQHHVTGSERNETPGAEGSYIMLSTLRSNERNNSLAFVPNVPLRYRACLRGLNVG